MTRLEYKILKMLNYNGYKPLNDKELKLVKTTIKLCKYTLNKRFGFWSGVIVGAISTIISLYAIFI